MFCFKIIPIALNFPVGKVHNYCTNCEAHNVTTQFWVNKKTISLIIQELWIQPVVQDDYFMQETSNNNKKIIKNHLAKVQNH